MSAAKKITTAEGLLMFLNTKSEGARITFLPMDGRFKGIKVKCEFKVRGKVWEVTKQISDEELKVDRKGQEIFYEGLAAECASIIATIKVGV